MRPRPFHKKARDMKPSFKQSQTVSCSFLETAGNLKPGPLKPDLETGETWAASRGCRTCRGTRLFDPSAASAERQLARFRASRASKHPKTRQLRLGAVMMRPQTLHETGFCRVSPCNCSQADVQAGAQAGDARPRFHGFNRCAIDPPRPGSFKQFISAVSSSFMRKRNGRAGRCVSRNVNATLRNKYKDNAHIICSPSSTGGDARQNDFGRMDVLGLVSPGL